MFYLGIDLGTTNIKVLVIDEAGQVLSRSSSAVETYKTSDGGVEQSIDQIFRATAGAVRQAAAKAGGKISAIGISSQGGAMQLFDAGRAPVGRLISWMDQRGRPYNEKLTAELGREFFREHIGFNASGLGIGQLCRLGESGQLDQAAGVNFLGDCLVEKLTGSTVHDSTSAALTLLYNPWRGEPDSKILQITAAEGKTFPAVIPANAVAGTLTNQAAGQLGLEMGMPVSPAVHDQYTACIAAGAVEPGDICIGTGTAWVLTATTTELMLPVIDRCYVARHPAGGGGQLVALGAGGSVIAWAMDYIGKQKFDDCDVDQLIAAAPAGCDGLRCVELTNHSGRFTGQTDSHKPAHFVRSVVEAIALKLRGYLQEFKTRGLAPKRLMMCGKAAASSIVSQIVSDVTAMDLICLDESDVSSYGAAVIATCLDGKASSLHAAARQLALKGKVRKPGRDNVVYEKMTL